MDGQYIKPKIFSDSLGLEFVPIQDRNGGTYSKDRNLHLVVIRVSKREVREKYYKIMQGVHANLAFVRDGTRSVELTHDAMRRMAVREIA